MPAPSDGLSSVDDQSPVAGERTVTARQTLLRYIICLTVSLACHLGITWSLHNLVGFPVQVAFLVSLVPVSVINFLVLRRYVFRASGSLLRR
jgi:putative flippase GtrA